MIASSASSVHLRKKILARSPSMSPARASFLICHSVALRFSRARAGNTHEKDDWGEGRNEMRCVVTPRSLTPNKLVVSRRAAMNDIQRCSPIYNLARVRKETLGIQYIEDEGKRLSSPRFKETQVKCNLCSFGQKYRIALLCLPLVRCTKIGSYRI